MLRNVTLSIDEDLLLSARKIALDRNTSVNQIVREHLEGLVRENEQQEAAMARVEEMFRESRFELGSKTWTRDSLYER